MIETSEQEQLQRRMEAVMLQSWRDLTDAELRCPTRANLSRMDRAYDRYLAAMDAYMRYLASQHKEQIRESV